MIMGTGGRNFFNEGAGGSGSPDGAVTATVLDRGGVPRGTGRGTRITAR